MRITVRDRGSLKIEIGENESFELVDGEGKTFGLGGRNVISLCRCGQSANAPFCDGAHGRCGYDSVVVARDLPAPAPKA